MNRIFILSILLLSPLVFANDLEQRAEFYGTGTIEVEPEYASIILTVRSRCYESPENARESTDVAVKNIFDFLKTFERPEDPYFKLLIDGGYVSSYSKWHQRKQYCENTFQKNTRITLHLGIKEDFDTDFAAIQSFVLTQFKLIEPKDKETPITFVELNSPVEKISDKKRKEVEKRAITKAVKDAVHNFNASVSMCENLYKKIIKIKDLHKSDSPNPKSHRVYFAQSESAKGGQMAPVRFKKIKVTRNVLLSFSFDLAGCKIVH